MRWNRLLSSARPHKSGDPVYAMVRPSTVPHCRTRAVRSQIGRDGDDHALDDIATRAPTTPERLVTLRSLSRGFER
jgi:hypothetical protein